MGPQKTPKRYTKHYYPGSVLAHFVAQSSPYAQRMLAASVGKGAMGSGRARVAWEKGGTLYEFRGKLAGRLNRKKVLEQLADAAVEHLRLGTEHMDIHGNNIVLSGGVLKPVRVGLIDYELARPLMGRHLDAKRVTGGPPGTNDYAKVMEHVIPLLAFGKRDEGRLRGFFRRKFLEKVERL